MECETDSESCDAILVTQLEVGGEEDMNRDAKHALEQAPEETLSVEELGGVLFVGNRRGLNFADRLRVLEWQVGEIPFLKTEIDAYKHRISSLEDRMESLTSLLEVYKLRQGQFISTYKKDKLYGLGYPFCTCL